ncbi:MAG: hypothetical protein HYY37_06350 [Candidatus Aenigmarchaeota archaeon]|nr:hypothetical protein [Candidatus Aenigmarchaeota archaeon]
MPYKVGISSGWWSIAKDPALLGLPIKAGGYGATSGVQFNQLDLEGVIEFVEPQLKKQIERMQRELGIELGLHGEIGEHAALESAERRIWELSHERLATAIKHAADLKFKYINIHFSSTLQLQQRERELRPFGWSYQVVNPFGRPFYELAEENSEAGRKVKEFIMRRMQTGSGIQRVLQEEEIFQDKWNAFSTKETEKERTEARKRIDEGWYVNPQNPARHVPPGTTDPSIVESVRQIVHTDRQNSGEWNALVLQFFYSLWKDPQCNIGKYVLEAGEIDASLATAVYMYHKNEPLWFNIVGGVHPETAYTTKPKEFNAATTAYYIKGHLEAKHPANDQLLGGARLIDYLNRNGLILTMETPQSGQGTEGLSRMYDPIDGYHLVKSIGSSKVKLCIDFEQVMGQNIDIDKMFASGRMPGDFGKEVVLIHLGEPIPYFGTAHIPISIGGRGQEILYGWLFELRKRGFKDGYMLFERGGGRGGEGGGATAFKVFEYSVWVLRQMSKYLDLNVEPKALPPEFFGISVNNKDIWATQVINMREHAWDPLKDLLVLPEETHTFLSKAAVEKGKGEVWERRKYR